MLNCIRLFAVIQDVQVVLRGQNTLHPCVTNTGVFNILVLVNQGVSSHMYFGPEIKSRQLPIGMSMSLKNHSDNTNEVILISLHV